MKKILILFLIIPLLLDAQSGNKLTANSTDAGIEFQQGLSWQQILAKAKADNKYIFLDCYTTWCAPCKQMESEVYPLKEVGDLFNKKFISVKMQMDTAVNDNEMIKASYADARYIKKHYPVTGYPTYLFCSPDGLILKTSVGAMDAAGFIKLASDASDPKMNYYALLADYKHGKRDSKEMSYLARTALELVKDTAQSAEIAKNYMLNQKKTDYLTKENIDFIYHFIKSSKDLGFQLFFQHTDTIDKIMGDDTYVQGFIQSIIYKEMVLPEIEKSTRLNSQGPDWNTIAASIKKKYNAYYSERAVTAAKSSLALKQKNWAAYTKYLTIFEDRYGSKTSTGLIASLSLNNYAWAVFLHTNSKEELNHALSWSGRAVLMYPNPNWMDTYANILYKLGRKQEAILWEESGSKLEPTNKNIQANLDKMKNDEPTWPKK